MHTSHRPDPIQNRPLQQWPPLEGAPVFHIEPSAGHAGVRQPGKSDVVEDVVSGEIAIGLAIDEEFHDVPVAGRRSSAERLAGGGPPDWSALRRASVIELRMNCTMVLVGTLLSCRRAGTATRSNPSVIGNVGGREQFRPVVSMRKKTGRL